MRGLRNVLVALALLACAPGTPAPPATDPPATEAADAPAESEPGTATPRPSQPRMRRPPLRYVALGDSLASGMDGIENGRSYADAYARLLERRTKREVKLTNLGVPGLNSTDLLGALRSSEQMRAAVASADVVTWDIGGNDLIEHAVQISAGTCGGSDGLACLSEGRVAFAERWSAIIRELSALRRSPRVRLQTFTLYRPFATIRGVRADALLRELDARNAIISDSDALPGVAVADVADAFTQGQQTDLIDEDGLHPTRTGHRAIAQALLAARD